MRGMVVIQAARPILQEKRSRMPGAYTTCTEMFGNGAVIGMMRIITRTVPRKIPQVLRRALPVFFAAVRGTAMLTTAVRLIATGAIPTTGSASTVSGVRLE